MVFFILLWIIIAVLSLFFILVCIFLHSDSEFWIGSFILLLLIALSFGGTTQIESSNKMKVYSIPTNFKMLESKNDVVYSCDELGSEIFTDIKYMKAKNVKIKHVYNFYGHEIRKEYSIEE